MFTAKSQFFAKNLLNTNNFTMGFNRQILFSRHFEVQKFKFEQNLVRCHGNQLDTTWFCLIGSINEASYMYQISCQSDELCRK